MGLNFKSMVVHQRPPRFRFLRFLDRGIGAPVRRGFTLIELMLVVAIIGLLAAIALPKFSNLIIKAKEASVKGKLGAVRSAISIYYVDNDGRYPAVLEHLTFGSRYLDAFPYSEIPIENPAPNSHRGNRVTDGGGAPIIDSAKGSVWWYDNVGLGTVFVDCTHTDTIGTPWTLY